MSDRFQKRKTIVWKIIDYIAPLTHFIPKESRKSFLDRLHTFLEHPFRLPKPFIKGKYPYGINLFGFFRSETGLAQGVKLFAISLEKEKIPHTLINFDFQKSFVPQDDTSYDKKLAGRPKYAVNAIHLNPPQWESALALYPYRFFDYRYNIGIWAWELEKLPDNWLPVLDDVDEIWTPSEFVANAVRKATDKPVYAIHYGISVPYDHFLTRQDFGFKKEQFLVLTMFDSFSWSSRKNPKAAIEAFARAFSIQDTNAHLVIKVNHPKDEDIEMIRETLGEENRFTLITDRMEKDKLNSLIRFCDVFISLHRSEGFGLVMAEAMALGTPVVATNWSSNVEFMPEETACMVDYSLVPVNDQYTAADPEFRWADPNVDQAADFLRKLYTDPIFYQEKAEKAQRYIESNFSLETAGRKIRERLHQILQNR